MTDIDQDEFPEIDDEPEGEGDSAEQQHAQHQGNRIRPKNVDELILAAIPERARYAGPNLRGHLTGKVRFLIGPSGKAFTVDWTSDEIKTAQSDDPDAACTIELSEADLMRIAAGELNPQVAMLSHKVRVQGNADHAIYVFNLIAPGERAP